METGLFEIQAEHLTEFKQARQALPVSGEVVALLRGSQSVSYDRDPASDNVTNAPSVPGSGSKTAEGTVELARCFLRVANLPNFALDRLSRSNPVAPSRPNLIRARCLGSSQTARKKTPLPSR
jgi:hypothetical protein